MRNVQNTIRSISYGETSWENGDSGAVDKRKEDIKNLVNRANSINILRVFKSYGLKISEYNKEIVCPFPHHKGGRENSASFCYYPATNSFWCFGCNTGIFATDFVAAMEGIHRIKAASKIIKSFDVDSNDDIEFETLDYSERISIMVDFSNYVREFRSLHTDDDSFEYIEKILKIYDELNSKLKLSNESLSAVLVKLKSLLKRME
jgi:RNA recognition motif-containing protein